VADVADETVRVISWQGPGAEDLITYATSRSTLLAPPDALDASQWEPVQRLTVQFAQHAQGHAEQLQLACTRLQDQANAAQMKIEAMRAYAIETISTARFAATGSTPSSPPTFPGT